MIIDMAELEVWVRDHENMFLADMASLMEAESVSDPERAQPNAPYGSGPRLALDRYLAIASRDDMECYDHQGHCGSVVVRPAKKFSEIDLIPRKRNETCDCQGMEVGIWGHLDVVPACGNWIYPEYALTKVGRTVIGRGAQDNKGPAMAVYYTLLYLKEHSLLQNISVRQILGCDEENGMRDADWFTANKRVPDFSFVADCVFPVCCGEKGKLHITLHGQTKPEGILSLYAGKAVNMIPDFAACEIKRKSGTNSELSAVGRAGHAAFPEGSQNAVAPLMEKILMERVLPKETELQMQFLRMCTEDGYGCALGIATEDEIFGKLTCNLGILRIENGVIHGTLDIRYPAASSGEEVFRMVCTLAARYGFTAEMTADTKPYYIPPDDQRVTALLDAYRDITGDTSPAYIMGGGTYAARIPRTVGFGTGMPRDFGELVFPPGHGGGHMADEAESVDNLEKAIGIYAEALCRLDRQVRACH